MTWIPGRLSLMNSSVYGRRKQIIGTCVCITTSIFYITIISRASMQLLTITSSPKTCASDKVEKRKNASEIDDASEGTVNQNVSNL